MGVTYNWMTQKWDSDNLIQKAAQQAYDQKVELDKQKNLNTNASPPPVVKDASQGDDNSTLNVLRRKLDEFKPPQGPAQGVGDAYQAKAQTGPLPEYAYLRNKVNEQSSQANSQAQDAIKRRFAAMGGLNSGSYIKQAQIQEDSSAKQKSDSMADIDFNEAQARRGLEKEEAQKEFTSQESQKGRQFQASQSSIDREFQSMVASFDAGSKLAQLEQSQKGLGLQENEQKTNQIIAAINQANSLYDHDDDTSWEDYYDQALRAIQGGKPGVGLH